MTIEILSYNSSVLNPLLKLVVLAAFVVAAFLFYRCWHVYGGILHDVSTLLLIGSVAGIIASAFRLAGDFIEQVKWGETIFDLILVTLILVISLAIRARMVAVTGRFRSDEGEEIS